MSEKTLPRSDAEVREVNEAFWAIIAENFDQAQDSADTDVEFNGIIEANYGPYVAEPLIVDGIGVFFPYDWTPEKLARSQELFYDFTPAPTANYPSFEDFVEATRPELNGKVGAFNFLNALAARQDTVMDMALEQKPAYQRAKLLAPDLGINIDALRSDLRKYCGETDRIPAELLHGVYELLNLAGKLVDLKDEYLFRYIEVTPEGVAYQIDANYLLH